MKIRALNMLMIGLLCMATLAQAQLLPHIISGKVKNPDGSYPSENEIKFQGYLTESPGDTTTTEACADSGGWAIEVVFGVPNSNWQAGDTLVVVFENIGGGEFHGAKQTLVYETTGIGLKEVVPDFELPVELTMFTASVEYGTFAEEVKLEWRTVGETNNHGFEVQKSLDNKSYEKIGFINGAGSTNNAQSYQFFDENVKTGTYFYRLRQIDYNGTSTTSDAQKVNVAPPQTYELSQNFPNPFNPTTEIIFRVKEENKVTIAVYDILGREVAMLVNKNMEAGTHRITFDGRNLASGMYLYRMKSGDYSAVKKMALIK